MFLVRRSMIIATSFPPSLFYFGLDFPRYNQPGVGRWGRGGAKHSVFLLFSLFRGPQASGIGRVVLRKCFVLAIIYLFFLTHSRWASTLLPSCYLWSLRIFPTLSGSCLTIFYRDARSALLQLVNQMVEFYLLTFPRFPLRKKEHKFW